MKTVDREAVVIGRITGVHGVKGEVKILLYGGYGEFPWKAVFIASAGCGPPESRSVVAVRRHKDCFLVLFEGVCGRGDALLLAGREVSIGRADLPPLAEDEFFVFDLVGLEAFSDEGQRLGLVDDVISTGASDVLVIKGPLGEVMVPIVEDAVRNVDLKAKKITIHLLEGLLPDGDEV